MNLNERAQFLIDNLDLPAATGVDDARFEFFQLALWSDDSTFRIENKSRQIAWSWAIAADALADALLAERDSIFVSINLEEAKEKIRYARGILDNLHIGGLPKLTRDSQFSLEFDNGARLSSLPSKAPRGRARANVYLDEFAHVQFDRQIYTAALPVISKGGRLRIGSSPLGASGVFWEVFDQKLRAYPGYNRRSTPWWEIYSFCTDVREARTQAPALETGQRVERYGNERIRAIYSNMPEDDFRQEYECHLSTTEVILSNGCSKKFIDLDIGDQLVYNRGSQLSTCKIIDFRRVGMRNTVKVTTETGAVFVASSGHKIKTRAGKESVDVAQELGYVFNLPKENDREMALARLVGYNLGDGTIAFRDSKYTKKDGTVSVYPYYQASFYSSDKQDLDRLASDMVVAGIVKQPPNVLFKKGARVEYDAYQIHVSRGASEKLIEAGCVVGKKVEQDFTVPEWILLGPAEVKAEFLGALFGAEGNTPRQKTQARNGKSTRGKLPQTLYLHMLKASENALFFEQIMDMLSEFGVKSVLSKRKEANGKTSFIIYVSTDLDNSLVFFDNIGYRYAWRKEEAAFLWSQYLRAYRYERDMRKNEVAILRGQGLSYVKIGKELGISAQGAYNLFNKEIKRSSWNFPLFSDWVPERYKDGTLYLKVTGREDAGEKEVFNITVDSPDNSYLLADGLDNFNCQFVDETSAWITWDEIRAAQTVPPECRSARAKGRLTPEVFEAIDAVLTARMHNKIESSFSVGVDIGRTRNATEIFIVGVSTTNQYPLRAMITLEDMEYDDQISVLMYVNQKLPVSAMLIDRNGIGNNLAENVARAYPARVEPVNFTNATKVQWATDAKMLIQQRRTPLPVDRDLSYQIHSIKRTVTASKNLVFDTERNEKHHADKFWAWALALAGAYAHKKIARSVSA